MSGGEIPHSIKSKNIMAFPELIKTGLQTIGTDIYGNAMNAAGNFINGFVSEFFADRARKKNYEYNEKAAQEADKRQRAQYQDLYSPEAQMAQYAAAGLSPSMMMSGGQSAVGGTPQGPLGGINGPMPSTGGGQSLMLADIANTNADTQLKLAQAKNTNKDTELKGQEIINLVSQNENTKASHRLIVAEADLKELELSTNLQTAQATIRQAYSNAEKAAQEARSSAVKADLDEATFEVAYNMAFANFENVLTDTALAKSEIGVNKAQIKEIAERIRNMQWQTWATEKEQNRKDAIFKFDQAKFKGEVEMWAREMNIELTGMKLDMVSDLVGYVCNFATCGLSNATALKKTEMYTNAQKEIANTNKPRNYTTSEMSYRNKDGSTNKVSRRIYD